MAKQHEKSKHRVLNHLRVVAFAALYAGCSTWVGTQADDTAIYVNKIPSAQTPNVMFSIDTSGSMDSIVPDGTQTRIEAVKDALTGLINDTSNLKAGLGRFHYELGGPIIFPVVNLDDAPDFLNETQSVSSIDRSSDDAEESGGVVTLDDQALEMTEIAVGGTTSITTREPQSADSDDDDEDGGSSPYGITSPDLDLGQEDAGVRFSNVDIPPNAVILHAEIEFQAAGSFSGETHVEIFGHDVDNSPPFVETGNNSIDDREDELTSASVRWSNIMPTTDGQIISSPNVREIVQEIVNRGGWATSNDMSFLLEDEGGQRPVTTVDGGRGAILRVQYVESATTVQYQVNHQNRDANESSGGNLVRNFNGFYLMGDDDFGVDFALGGMIFPNVDIPAGADVVWADITWTTRNEVPEVAPNMEIYGMLQSDPGNFESGNSISDRPLTTSTVVWNGLFSEGDEEIFAPDDDELMLSPNLESLIEEVRTSGGYAAGNNLGFVFKDEAGGGIADRHMCSFDGVQNVNGCPEDTSARPTLRIVYGFPSGGTPVQQQVGLRFNNIRVPQGATIDSAHLEFTVDSTTTEPGNLTIEIEDNTSPATYSATNPVSTRSYGNSTTWTTDVWDTIGEKKQSPDISSLVSQVTSDPDWCGGSSLAFRITSPDARVIAEAFDKGGSGAPTLRIEYDTSTLTASEGCTTRQTTVSITDEDDDVEEFESSGFVDLDDGDLDIEPGLLVGLRFPNVQVPVGATVTSTNLFLTSDEFDDGSTSIDIYAQQHPNAPAFTASTSNVSNRFTTSDTKATWSISSGSSGEWVEDEIYSVQDDGVDLTPLISDIINGTIELSGEQWASGNSLVFILDGQGPNDRDAEVCCGADPSARLEIFYEFNLGDQPDFGEVTGREAMLSIVDELVASGFTPPVDALFEAGSYFASWPVHFGRTRGAGQSYESSGVTNDGDLDSQIDDHWDSELLVEGELSRLSHPATYTPSDANIVRQGSCTELDPNNRDCRTEHIENGVAATYVSPFEGAEECEKGFLVLLSDGIANRNSSRDLIQGLTGNASCPLDIPLIDSNGDPILNGDSFSTRDPSSDELCGLELAQWLHLTDFIDEPNNAADVLNNVRTFTIGFNLPLGDSESSNRQAVEFLKALAFVGNGGDLSDPDGVDGVAYGDGFYTANTADELQSVFETIVNEIIQETTSFVAPGISINAFNRLFNLNDIYFSLFRPDDSVAWLGNMKKFKLCTAEQDANGDCDFGEVVDANGDPAVFDDNTNLDTFGTLKSEAVGFWSTADDAAPEIDQGGAGELIPTYPDRNVYVNTSDGTVTPPDYSGNSWEEGTSPHKIDLDNDVGSEPASGDPADFNELKTALRDQGNCDSGSFSEQNACLNDLIEWITGKKFPGDLPRDGTESDVDRWAFGDPMHSRPLVLTYGKNDGGTPSNPDDDLPLSKIIVGTNDGGIRMLNEGDGVEEWIYFPNSMLFMQSELKENPKDTHRYGVDDTPTARIRNVDSDSIIEPGDGDFVHLYFGLRRGGRQIFALNATPDSTVTGVEVDGETIGQKGLVEPELLWRIDGTDPKFQRLGLTFSTPRPVRIQGQDGPRTVLIFGGGYDLSQDGEDTDGTPPDGGDVYNTSSSGDSMGNAIFMVDADTGERLWWTSNSVDGNGDAPDALVSAMNTSIAAGVTTVDINNDGLVDRLYAVDLRGQVFRVDFAVDGTATDDDDVFDLSTVGILAQLGDAAANEDRRKFFYAPEVSRVNDTAIVEEPYELVGIVSGNRSQPQGQTVLDRAYAVRDFLTENPSGGLTGTNFPACNPKLGGCTPGTPLSNSDLTDVTDQGTFVIRDETGGNISLTDASGTSLTSSSESVLNLQESYGWRFDLEGVNADLGEEETPADPTTGEKGFSAVTVLGGKMFFTTFLPPDTTASSENACSVPEVLGTSRFYAVDFFTGAPAFDRNTNDTFEKTERFTSLGAGPSADVVPAYLPGGVVLPVPTGAGAVPQDPGLTDTVKKSFWLEEQ